MKLHANLGTKDNFENALLDLFTTVAPTINIMDGIVGMEGNGPANGKPVRSNMLLASTNGLALDIVAMSQIGIGVKDVGYIEKGLKRKWRRDLQKLKSLVTKFLLFPMKSPLPFWLS